MPRLTRLRRDDRGAVATFVAILLAGGVLIGMAALVVDIGRIYAERRELQNGADSAVLAVAQDCAQNLPCDSGTGSGSLADIYSDANARDGASGVTSVCGRGAATLSPCSQPSSSVYDCPPLPGANVDFVEVRTATQQPGGSTLLPPFLAQALVAGYTGTTVNACARAAWGAPSQIQSALPVTLSLCEWQNYTAGGTDYAPPPPYDVTGYPAAYEHAIYLHNTTGATNCPAGPSGSDLPGGFGWLDSTGCSALIDENDWVGDDTGVSVNRDCRTLIDDMVGTVIYLPVFDQTNDLTGTNGEYRIRQFAAFYLSGYHLPAGAPPRVDSPVGGRLCRGSDKCLYGWFTTGVPPSGGPIGGGPYMGTNIVQLVG